MKTFTTRRLPLAASIAAIIAAVPLAQAQGNQAQSIEEVVVTGSLGSLPGEDVQIFGFGKSLLETPRSASTISEEQLERFNITDIDELVAFAPGTFTQSFFGVAGSLDVRGTAGETYFRGMRRIDNPGNYPTPIGASDRIDIVRGPASPIYGPAKIGGYLNFNPKSARAESGDYLSETTGAVSYETGSWNRNVVTAEIGGPINDRMGYYLYGELEDSDSFYDNTETKQNIIQASFDVDINDKLVMQFGGMYHDYDGNQVAGWNRLTQDLIDNGTYITGQATPLDTDGDGKISHQEYGATSGPLSNFVFRPEFVDDSSVIPEMALVNTGTTQLDESNVLVDPNDTLDNQVLSLYLDFVYETDSGFSITNKLFYETIDNINENAYGFSQFGEVDMIEDKLVFAFTKDIGSMTADLQFSPSIRYTDFLRGQDFINEYFDRRDLSQSNAERDPSLDTRLLATQINDDYSEYQSGDYTMYGLAFLGDFSFDNGIAVTLGIRQDYVETDVSTPVELLLFPDGAIPEASDSEDLLSWSASINWTTEFGLTPYFTIAEQATLIAGQVGDLPTAQVASGSWTDTSDLWEVGLKGSFLDDSLYFAVNYYEQERVDFNAQAIVTNPTSRTEGIEAELRWVVNEDLVVTGGWTNMEVIIVEAEENGGQFGFYGADDIPQIDPTLVFGGQIIGIPTSPDGRRAGIPENIYTLTGTYSFNDNLAISGSVISVDETPSGSSGAVILPSYTLLNAGLVYETESWTFQLNAKNLTDERYFRSNFPDLFGSQIVLPELSRNFQARVAYKF
ncbi:TonB-dependent siderophore receptor [Congregibacter litoralis]|uniref:Outer membrane receptor protein, mostly Fe transport n=1 Tax=Congregibacter litoralis KT71 TaxID=314285 RepID=A4ADR4_9GAMM|nr:TonB-dependent receptor [Congregibacter litoralis]EAQ95872.1 Outer membrane receptor protein, mostly Fe transport [Congregibacter litoralis KT71]